MKLETFLAQYTQHIVDDCYKKFIFYGAEYPVLFFSLLNAALKKQGYWITVLDISEWELGTLIATCETALLGQRGIYILKNGSLWSGATEKKFLSYMQHYQGPHCLLYHSATQKVVPDSPLAIIIQKGVTRSLLEYLARLDTGCDPDNYIFFVHCVDSSLQSITLERACLLLHYYKMVSSEERKTWHQYVEHLKIPEQSLFTLSQYFFAQKRTQFYEQWFSLVLYYTELFWISFWSDQLWRAYHIVYFCTEKQQAHVQKMAFRMPFSFMRFDWKRYSLRELQQAHDFIYSFDYHVKQGGNNGYLDLFYGKFFNREFTT